MTRRLLISYLSLAIVVLAMLEVPLGFVNARGERAQLTAKVERDAVAIASLAESTIEGDAPTSNLPAIARLARRYAAETGARVVITNRTGRAVVDSAPPTPGRRSFATRPEFRAALRGDVATGTRHSATLGYDRIYVAVPIASGGTVHGAVRITYPTSELDRRVREGITALGFPGQPSHPICHGIGARAHEPPVAHQAGGGTIEEGMVLAIEPGCYWDEGGGLRVEDNFLITSDGPEKLSSFPDGIVQA